MTTSEEYTRGWNDAMDHAARIADSLAESAAVKFSTTHDPLLDVRQEEDGSWSVSVRAMPGHIGCAMTLPEAYAEAHDAALAWVEAARETPPATVLPTSADPNAVEVAPGTYRHWGLYLRGKAPTGLDVDVLAAAMNDAQITAEEIAWGHDLRVPARRILAALNGEHLSSGAVRCVCPYWTDPVRFEPQAHCPAHGPHAIYLRPSLDGELS